MQYYKKRLPNENLENTTASESLHYKTWTTCQFMIPVGTYETDAAIAIVCCLATTYGNSRQHFMDRQLLVTKKDHRNVTSQNTNYRVPPLVKFESTDIRIRRGNLTHFLSIGLASFITRHYTEGKREQTLRGRTEICRCSTSVQKAARQQIIVILS